MRAIIEFTAALTITVGVLYLAAPEVIRETMRGVAQPVIERIMS